MSSSDKKDSDREQEGDDESDLVKIGSKAFGPAEETLSSVHLRLQQPEQGQELKQTGRKLTNN